MSNKIIVPWLRRDFPFMQRYDTSFDEKGISIQWINSTSNAIRIFTCQQAKLLIMQPDSEAGDWKSLLDLGFPSSEQYSNLIEWTIENNLELVRKTRFPESVNHATPIIVFGLYGPSDDPSYKNIARAFEGAGATNYVYALNDEASPNRFTERISKLIQN